MSQPVPDSGLIRSILGLLSLLVFCGGFGLTITCMLRPRLRAAIWPRRESRSRVSLYGAMTAISIFMIGYSILMMTGSQIFGALGRWSLPAMALCNEVMMIVAVMAAFFSGRVQVTEIPSRLGLDRPGIRHLISGLAGWLCCIWFISLVVIAISILYRGMVGEPVPAQRAIKRIAEMSAEPRLVTALVATVAAPLCEEILFRGVIFRALRLKIGFIAAALLSGVLFGLIHMEPFQAVQLSMLGIVLAWLYERTGSLWPSVFLHFINNAVTMAVVLLGVHG